MSSYRQAGGVEGGGGAGMSAPNAFLQHDATPDFRPVSATQARVVRELRKKREAVQRGRQALRAASRGEHLKKPKGKSAAPSHLASPSRSRTSRPASAHGGSTRRPPSAPARPASARRAFSPAQARQRGASPGAQKKSAGYSPWIEAAYEKKCASEPHPKKVTAHYEAKSDGIPGLNKNKFVAGVTTSASTTKAAPCLRDFPAAPQCPGKHGCPIIRGVPPDYTQANVGMHFSVVCDRCGCKDLQREPHYFHCAICKFDLCMTCKNGKKIRPPAEPPTPPKPKPPRRVKEVPLDAAAADTMKMTGASWADQQPQMGPVMVESKRGHPMSCPLYAETEVLSPKDPEGKTANQRFKIGDEVEVGDHDDAALRGKRGVIVGKHRGRFGVDLRCSTPNLRVAGSRPVTPQSRIVSFLPSHLQSPGDTTRAAPYPFQLDAGDFIELCHTDSQADGARARVTRVGAAGVDVELQNYGEVNVPMQNVCFPVGSAVRVNNRAHILHAHRGRVVGYRDGLAVVRLPDERTVPLPPQWLQSGLQPDSRPPTPATPAGRGVPDTPPAADASVARDRRKVGSTSHAPPPPHPPNQSSLQHTLVASLRTALLHTNGHLTFVKLRRALGHHPATMAGLRQVCVDVGLSDLVNDATTIGAVFRMFVKERRARALSEAGSCPGTPGSSRPPTPQEPQMDQQKFINALRRRCPEKRARLILQVFAALDKEKKGYLPNSRVKRIFLPAVHNPMAPTHFQTMDRVPQEVFDEYYKDVSAAMTSDDGFRKALVSSWKVDVAAWSGWAQATQGSTAA